MFEFIPERNSPMGPLISNGIALIFGGLVELVIGLIVWKKNMEATKCK